MADKRKAPWGMIVLTAFVAFCVLPVGLWYGAYQKGDRLYEKTKADWSLLCSRLVAQDASVEEVKSSIRAEGKEPFENKPRKLYDGSMTRHSVGTVIDDLEPASPLPRFLIPYVYFDEDGIAIAYEVREGGTAL